MHRASVRIPLACSTLASAALLAFAAPPARAEEALEMTIAIKDHKFEPAKLKVPAGKPVKLTVNNLDATPEEFESYPLQFEKVIAGNQSAVIRIRPLTEGRYDFFGEYHEATAQGAVVVE
jgi:plastocyanin